MYRSLGRLFINCGKERILLELNENKTTLETEHKNYSDMSKTYKEKQEHFTKQLNDMTAKK